MTTVTADEKEVRVAEWLVNFWPLVIDDLSRNHCILGARVAVEVGSYFGVTVTERATRCLVANAQAWPLIVKGIPLSEWPDEAWSVGIDPDDSRNGGLSGYSGHVVAETEHFLIDLSAGQFDRPERGLVMGGPALLPRPEDHDDTETWTYGGPGGTVIAYHPLDDRSYRDAPDWRDESHWRPKAALLIRMMRARVKGERDE